MERDNYRYLRCLAELYPNCAETSREIINLQSVMNLPKGTEHFISDIHGEYAAFSHVLRNGSGAVRKKIDDVFGHTLDNSEKRALATLIYYPKERIKIAKQEEEDIENWFYVTIYRLIKICKVVSSKYTRKRMRKAMPPAYEYIIEELITEKPEILDKESYYNSIVETIVDIDEAENFIFALCELIHKLVIDRLHIIGDIFDRGPEPHKIMDALMSYHSVDVEWGNHDIVWMGAAAGQPACIATVIRNASRYGNLSVLEDGYGINLTPLITYAMYTYADDPCACFKIHSVTEETKEGTKLEMKVQKTITMLQFKLEGQTILRHPEYHMENRLLLDKIDYENRTVTIDGEIYPMLDTNFPSINNPEFNLASPYDLTDREQNLVNHLVRSFKNSEKLQKHIHFLLNKGNIYRVHNNNLLYHGCMPLNEDGSFRDVEIYGKTYHGKALYDVLENYIRKAFASNTSNKEAEKGRDIMWWIWCAPDSPLFGKDKMATFEGYFLEDKGVKKEHKDYYYTLLEQPQVADMIMKEFGCEGPYSHIINGHVPVHLKEGETPIRCNSRVLIIDGGFSKPYQKVTGIAGYTLIYNSWGMTLAAHEPFVTTEQAIRNQTDIISHTQVVYQTTKRCLIKDTDQGKKIAARIDDLKKLLEAYRTGMVKENETF